MNMQAFERIRIKAEKVTFTQLRNVGECFHPTMSGGHSDFAALLCAANTPSRLAALLNTTQPELEHCIGYPAYTSFGIPKKSGGVRHISSPDEMLMSFQRRLNFYLQHYYSLLKPEAVHGFVLGEKENWSRWGIVSNAYAHVNKRLVINIDIKDFFNSISVANIFHIFRSPYFNFDVNMAKALALLTTYKKSLPTGAPTSPVLSNFYCLHLDIQLQSFARQHQLTYTRYADDLTFSSDKEVSDDMMLDIFNLIMKAGFELNFKKYRKQYAHEKQVVTGLVVNEKVNVDRRFLKTLRAILHRCSVEGIEAAAIKMYDLKEPPTDDDLKFFIRQIGGYLAFIGQVRGTHDGLYQQMTASFRALVPSESH
jgi:RNA-directed DNA polymerase